MVIYGDLWRFLLICEGFMVILWWVYGDVMVILWRFTVIYGDF